MSIACAVIVFAKAPVPGQVKTRLAPVLGEAGAARLAVRMLDDAIGRALAAAIGPVELCCAPDAAHPAFRVAEERGAVLTVQGDGDLGQRMQRALERALRQHPRALLIGTDAPGLDASLLQRAAAALDSHDAVFVPATDGGYVLVGLRRSCPDLFADIAWSTPQVMQTTRTRASQAGISLHELDAVRDIDEPEDLAFVPKEWLK